MAIILNVVLFICKFLIGSISGSMAIMADAWNNILDAGNAVIALIGVKIAGYDKGEKHPFGHGRMEWMVSLFSSMVVMLAGYELVQTSIESIRNPQAITVSFIVMLVLVLSIAVKLFMFFYYRKAGKEKDSETMKTMAVDSLCDSVATGTVLIATILNVVFGWQIDGWCGIIVSAFIIYSGFASINATAKGIVGKAPAKELVERVEQLVKQHGEIKSIQEMTIHDYGVGRFMVAMKIEVDSQANLSLSKSTPEAISYALYQELGCDSTIQMNYLVEDEKPIQIYKRLKEEIYRMDENLFIQNFRTVQAGVNKIIHADIYLPIQLEKKKAEIRKRLDEMLFLLDQDYRMMVKFKMTHNRRKHKMQKIDTLKGNETNKP